MSNVNEINRIVSNGSGLLDGSESIDLTGSDTHQIVAISILEDSTTFTALEGAQGTGKFVDTQTTADWITEFGAAAAGAKLANGDIFPAGLTLYGKWDKITVNAGSVIFYTGAKAFV